MEAIQVSLPIVDVPYAALTINPYSLTVSTEEKTIQISNFPLVLYGYNAAITLENAIDDAFITIVENQNLKISERGILNVKVIPKRAKNNIKINVLVKYAGIDNKYQLDLKIN